ncbi:MAG: hypothetical protein ACFB15_08370 [Cyclobacteriaceae bacterium]
MYQYSIQVGFVVLSILISGVAESVRPTVYVLERSFEKEESVKVAAAIDIDSALIKVQEQLD